MRGPQGALFGAITHTIQGRLAGNFETQSRGRVKTLSPDAADERRVIKACRLEGHIQWKFSDGLDFRGKLSFAQRAIAAAGTQGVDIDCAFF